MIFGDGLHAAPNAEPAAWLEDILSLRAWTVGGLLPTHYERYLLLEPAPPEIDDWWSAQSELVSALAEVLVGFTTTPERSWFAIWEGHGFDGGATIILSDPRTADDREKVRAARTAAAEEDERRTRSVREALGPIPRFTLPDRTYYLLTGHTLEVSNLRWPTEPSHWERTPWFRPDLWWPEDRSWFVATDVDLWCNYIGGTEALIAAIAARLPTHCRPATPDEPLRSDD